MKLLKLCKKLLKSSEISYYCLQTDRKQVAIKVDDTQVSSEFHTLESLTKKFGIKDRK